MADGTQPVRARRPIPGAGVVLRAPTGRVLFLQRGPDCDEPGTWCWPGGTREGGEQNWATAERELHEETGWTRHAPSAEWDPLYETEDFDTYATDVAEEFVPRLNDEHVDFTWAHPHEAPEPLHPGVEEMLASDCLAQDAAIPPELIALDRDSVRSYDKDERLHIEMTNISKANVCPYLGNEIPGWQALGLDPDRVYQLLRDPEELARAAPTFNNLPVLKKHVPVNAKDHKPDLVVGSTGTDCRFVDPYLQNSMVIWVKDSIDRIENETQREISSAYYYRADMTPGEFKGVRYDGVMRDIVGNHTCLVEDGRAGDDVVVGDAALKIAADTKDASGHEHDASGKFGSGSGGKKTSEEHASARSKQLQETIARNKGQKFKGYQPGDEVTVESNLAKGKATISGFEKHGNEVLANVYMHDVPKHEEGHRNAGQFLVKTSEISKSTTAMDSKEKRMSKPVLTRKAALLQGALVVHLSPRLAQDASIDFAPILKGVGPKNYVKRKPAIHAAITAACVGKLAQDATLDDMHQLLDSLDDVQPAEDTEEELLEAGSPVDTAKDADGVQAVLDMLTDKVDSDTLNQVKALLSPPAAHDEDEDENGEGVQPKAEDEEDDGLPGAPPAEDDEEDDKKMITQGAMDSAIATAVNTATQRARAEAKAIREAETAVRPYVGELIACDSAEGVYRAAFAALKVDVKNIHPSAFPAILKMQPVPGVRQEITATPLAMDSKKGASFAERFPEAARLASV